jgi:hypothetical protein
MTSRLIAVLAGVVLASVAFAPVHAQPGTVLSDEEYAGLLEALDAEHYSYALYSQVIEDFGQVRPFIMIRQAEAMHIAHLLPIFEAFGAPAPENPHLGQVPRYGSFAEACQAAVKDETAQIERYARLMAATDEADILAVYQALQWGNQMHLRAFSRCAP